MKKMFAVFVLTLSSLSALAITADCCKPGSKCCPSDCCKSSCCQSDASCCKSDCCKK